MKRLMYKKFIGLTLIEAMIAVVILGFACAAVVLPFTGGAALTAQGSQRTLAAKLAADLIEQIVNTPFDQILAIYEDYQEGKGKMKKADGTFFTQSIYSNFSRAVVCENWPLDNPKNNFIIITVTVFYDGKQLAQVHRLIGR